MTKTGATVCQHGVETLEHCFMCCKDLHCKRCDKIAEEQVRDLGLEDE